MGAAEGMFAYHYVEHDLAIGSSDCSSKLISHMFDRNFSCAHTKRETTASNVPGLYANEELSKDLSDATSVIVSVSASNRKSVKLISVLVGLFYPMKDWNIAL
jgi:hypothetical protein